MSHDDERFLVLKFKLYYCALFYTEIPIKAKGNISLLLYRNHSTNAIAVLSLSYVPSPFASLPETAQNAVCVNVSALE